MSKHLSAGSLCRFPGKSTPQRHVFLRWSSTTPTTPAVKVRSGAVERGRFTRAEDDLISRRIREGIRVRLIAEELNRNGRSVQTRLHRKLVLDDPSLRRQLRSRSNCNIDQAILDGVDSGRWLKDIAKELGLQSITVATRLRQLRSPSSATAPSQSWSWTVESNDQLRALYQGGKNIREIAMSLGRTMGAVKSQAFRLGLRRRLRRLLTPEEDQKMQSLLASGRSRKEISDILGRESTNVYLRLASLSRRPSKLPRRPWTSNDKQEALRLYHDGHSHAYIAQRLNRSKNAVKLQIMHLRDNTAKSSFNPWTTEETQSLLRLHDEGVTFKEMMTTIPGRTATALRKKFAKLRKRRELFKHQAFDSDNSLDEDRR